MAFNSQVSFVNTFQVSTKEANLPAILKGSLAFGGTTNPIPKVFCKVGFATDVFKG